MKISALIAAAGKAAGTGKLRPMLKLSGTTMIQKEIDTLRRAGISSIVVITGYEAEDLERHLAHRGVFCLRNEEYENMDMFGSVKLGLRYLHDRCDRILFLPADAPLFSFASVQEMMRSDARLAVPVFRGRKGHPVLFSVELIPKFLEYEGNRGLRGAMDVCGEPIREIPVEDPGVLLKAGSADQYEQLLVYERQLRMSQTFSYRITLSLTQGDGVFDPETAKFLEQIEKKGSMLSACKTLNMSYSRGWKMIKEIEEALGFAFLERKAGGSDGGKSRLTAGGKDFLERYRGMQRDISRAAEQSFQLYFEHARGGK